jgi:hypothetical protein
MDGTMKKYEYQQLFEPVGLVSDDFTDAEREQVLKLSNSATTRLNDLLESGFEVYKNIPIVTQNLAGIKYILRKELSE